MEPTEQSTRSFYGWKNAALLFFIVMFSMGVDYNAFTITFPSMIEAMGWGRAQASVAQTMNMILAGFITPLVALFMNRYGGRLALTLGLMIMAVGLGLLGTVTTELWQWIVLWGVLMPIGFAFGGLIPVMSIITYWFDIRRATVMGLVLSGGSLGGVVAQPGLTWIIENGGGWQWGWKIAGIVALVAFCISFWIKGKPDDVGQEADGSSAPAIGAGAAGNLPRSARTYRSSAVWTVREVIRTRPAWMNVIIGTANMMAFFMFIAHGRLHITDLGYTRMQAACVLSAIILGSGCSRFPMGWLGDRIEPRWIISSVLGLMIPAVLGVWQAPNQLVLLAGGFALGFGFGTIMVLSPVVYGNYFGASVFASITAFMTPLMIIFAGAVPVGAGFIADRYGSYDLAFMALAAVLALALCCSFFLLPPKK